MARMFPARRTTIAGLLFSCEFSTFALSLFVVVFGVRLVACLFSGEGEHYRADEARDEDERGSWVDCHQVCRLVV